MALVPFIQKRGSVGASTFMGGRHGTVERSRRIPTNPDTLAQQNARSRIAAVASEWRGLTDEARAGWKTLAAQMPGNLITHLPLPIRASNITGSGRCSKH